MYKSQGVLHYKKTENAGLKLIVEVDLGIYYFYRSLIPKYIQVASQRYKPHISVVRKEIPQLKNWGKYEGLSVNFYYDSYIYNDEIYWWLNVFSNSLEEIRFELGLPINDLYTLPPQGFQKCFHMTLGNTKTLI